MRLIAIACLLALCMVGCKKEEAQAPAPKPAAAPTPSPAPAPTLPKGVRGPNSDKHDIIGKWNATRGADSLQFEFTPTDLTIRKGSEVKTVEYTLRNELSPSQLDWGTADDGGFGLYALDGNNLYIDYQTGGPDKRPKKLGKPTTAIQLEFQRVK